MNHDVERDGFEVVPGVVGEEERRGLVAALGPVVGAGRRGLLAWPVVGGLVRLPGILAHVRPHLRAEPIPVRAIYFDKSPEWNWLVPWHQDLSVAIRGRVDLPGFGPWSTKAGIPHVQPPVEILQQMITVRLHLDDADDSNGALRVLPGSHRLGVLSDERIRELRARQTDFLCAVPAGGALLMRPLLLHTSSRSTSTRHRRVLHIEYAGCQLPEGLEWNEAA